MTLRFDNGKKVARQPVRQHGWRAGTEKGETMVAETKPNGNGQAAPTMPDLAPGRIAAGRLLGSLDARHFTVWARHGKELRVVPEKNLTAEDRRELARVRDDLVALLTDQGRVHPDSHVCGVLQSVEGLEEIVDSVLRYTIRELSSLSPREAARVTLLIEDTTRRLFRLADRLEEEDKKKRERRARA
jgi:hypothetical protein